MANESNLLVLPKKLGLNKNHKRQNPSKNSNTGSDGNDQEYRGVISEINALQINARRRRRW